MKGDGSDQKQVTSNDLWEYDPAFAPDGQTIAFDGYGGNDDIDSIKPTGRARGA